jgi:hypothetical protein
MAIGSFFKGEKKKKKKSDSNKPISFAPTFTPPSVIKKGKEKY